MVKSQDFVLSHSRGQSFKIQEQEAGTKMNLQKFFAAISNKMHCVVKTNMADLARFDKRENLINFLGKYLLLFLKTYFSP